MALAERVVHLIEDGRQRARAVVAEVEAQRIEGPAENARHAQKADGPALKVDVRRRQLGLDVGPQRAIPWAVVPVAEAEEIEAVVREEAQIGLQAGQFVQVDQHLEDAVAQAMPHRTQPLVGHPTLVKR